MTPAAVVRGLSCPVVVLNQPQHSHSLCTSGEAHWKVRDWVDVAALFARDCATAGSGGRQAVDGRDGGEGAYSTDERRTSVGMEAVIFFSGRRRRLSTQAALTLTRGRERRCGDVIRALGPMRAGSAKAPGLPMSTAGSVCTCIRRPQRRPTGSRRAYLLLSTPNAQSRVIRGARRPNPPHHHLATTTTTTTPTCTPTLTPTLTPTPVGLHLDYTQY